MPELIRDLSFDGYCDLQGINASAAKWGKVSMSHMHAAINGAFSDSDTADRKFGRAVHCRLLEPDRYAADFKVATVCSSQFKNGAPCMSAGKFTDGANWYCGRHKTDDCEEPTDYINLDESERIEAMAKGLHGHPAMPMLRRHGWSEVSIQYERRGIACKCRIDRLPEAMDIVLDLKKCQVGKATDRACQDAIARYRYHMQAAMYVDAVRAVHPVGAVPRFAWVFIEDAPPYGVNVLFADDQMIETGREELDDVLLRYQRCTQLGVWPDYMPGNVAAEIALPEWYAKQWNRERESVYG